MSKSIFFFAYNDKAAIGSLTFVFIFEATGIQKKLHNYANPSSGGLKSDQYY